MRSLRRGERRMAAYIGKGIKAMVARCSDVGLDAERSCWLCGSLRLAVLGSIEKKTEFPPEIISPSSPIEVNTVSQTLGVPESIVSRIIAMERFGCNASLIRAFLARGDV